MKGKDKANILYVIKCIICVSVIWGFGHLTPLPGLQPLGMKVLGIFLGMLFGWLTIGYVWPSIMGALALGLSGYQSVNDVITYGLGNASVTALVLFLCMLAQYVEDIGLSNYISNWFISRKFTIGKPWLFTGMLFLCAYVLGAAVSLYASILLMWGIFYTICEKVGYQRYDKYPILGIIGIAYSALLGFVIFPYKPMHLITLGSIQALSGLVVGFAEFAALAFVMSVLGLGSYLAICKFIIRPDTSLLRGSGDLFSHLRNQKMNREQKTGIAFLAVFFFAMFAPSVFPSESFIGSFFSRLGMTGSLLLVLAVMAMVKIDGKPVFNIMQAAKGVKWEMIILFMGTMPVASAMSSSETGVMDFIVTLISPIFEGMSPFAFTITFLLFAAILVQFVNNVVVAAVFPAIIYSFCISFDANVFVVISLFTFIVTVAFATPGGGSIPAMVYSNKDWIDSVSAMKYCTLVTVINILLVLVVGIGLGQIIFS
ncbi:MAG: hypothetical protein IJB37_01030 [Peptococcaceae bacterium]|nr:hypothetical protein [Peptococcaceae bacterium]